MDVFIDLDFGDRQFNGKQSAVFAPRSHRANPANRVRFAGCLIASDIAVVFRRIGFCHQHVNFATDELFRAVTKYPLGALVKQCYTAAPVDGYNGVLSRGDETAQPGFAFPNCSFGLSSLDRRGENMCDRFKKMNVFGLEFPAF